MTDTLHQPVSSASGFGTLRALTAYPHPQPQPLAQLSAAPGQAVTVLHPDYPENAVVLSQVDGSGLVRVLVDGQVRSLRGDVDAMPVTDTAVALDLARQAVAWALTAQQDAVDEAHALVVQCDELRQRHIGELAEIRAYAIDRHRDGDICRDGLNAFLTRFGLAPYQPRHRVRFTISGSCDVIPDVGVSVGDTGYDVREYLRLDTDQVDGVDEATVTFDVTAQVESHDA